MRMTSWGPLLPVERQRLRRLRLAVPWTLTELAERSDCSVAHLRRVETTEYRPSPELAARLAQALSDGLGRRVSLDEFFTFRPPKPRSRS